MTRLLYLDNLRSFALLLGLVFHTAIVYSSGVGYTVKSTETSNVYTWFVLGTHTFRMPLFFFLSGYFAELVLTKKGTQSFLGSRISRLVLPGLVGLCLFAPVDGFFRGESSLLFPPSYPMHWVNFFTGENFTLSHIWFLYYLTLFCFLYLSVRKVILYIPKIKNIYLLQFLFLLFAFGTIFIPNLFYTKEDFLLEIRPMFFFYYFFFFLFGTYIYKNELLDNLIPSSRYMIFLSFALAICLGLYMFIEEIDQYWMIFLHDPNRIRWRVFHLVLEVFLAIGISLVLLSFFRTYMNWESESTRELSKSLLPVYLVHHPVSIYFGNLFGDGNLPRDLAFFVHLSLVFIISFSYYSIVKKFRTTSYFMGIQPEAKPTVAEIVKS